MNKIWQTLKLYGRYALRRLGAKGYQVHQIYLPEQKLIYIPVPKNACTSIKHALHEIEFGTKFTPEKRDRLGMTDIHDFYQKRPEAFTSVKRLENMQQVIRFAVVRDPVDRLISCYRNRVVDLDDLQSSLFMLKKMNLPAEPDINTFVLNLDSYRKANSSIAHHAQPQHEFLGGSLDYLDKIFPIEEMEELRSMLRKYGWQYEMRTVKSGGTSFGVEDLSEEALRHAVNYYRQDYELLSSFYTSQQYKISS